MGSRLVHVLSFSHVDVGAAFLAAANDLTLRGDVGDAFHFINQTYSCCVLSPLIDICLIIIKASPTCMCKKRKRSLVRKKTNSGGTQTPSFNHQGERKAFQAYCISPYIKLIRLD